MEEVLTGCTASSVWNIPTLCPCKIGVEGGTVCLRWKRIAPRIKGMMHDLCCTINSFNPTGELDHQPQTTFVLLNDPKSYKVRVVQWWEHSPPVNVARVRILASRAMSPYVGWVCCWFYPSLQEVFLLGFRFSPLPQNQLFQIPILSGKHGYVLKGS